MTKSKKIKYKHKSENKIYFKLLTNYKFSFISITTELVLARFELVLAQAELNPNHFQMDLARLENRPFPSLPVCFFLCKKGLKQERLLR
jgi:hypothetical protein